MEKTKIKQIREILQSLYTITSQEIESFMQEVRLFNDEGLTKTIEELKKAKQKQDDLVTKFVEADPNFTPNLTTFVTKTSKNLKNQYEEGERKSTDSLLENL